MINDHCRSKGDEGDVFPPQSNFFHFHAVFGKNLVKQECIPVGYIPTTAEAATLCKYWGSLSTGGSLSRGGLPPERGRGVSFQRGEDLCSGGESLSREGSLSGGALPTPPTLDRRALPEALPSFSVGNNRLLPQTQGLASPWEILDSPLATYLNCTKPISCTFRYRFNANIQHPDIIDETSAFLKPNA